MNPKFLWLLTAILLVPIHPSDAQQPTKVPRIGYLTGATPGGQAARIDAFRQGLRELGYVEGKNIVVEYRYAEEI
jgi:putative tryptophan/tyrosine transport system substrate-binding protein